MLYKKLEGSAVPWDGGPINDVRYGISIENLWSNAQLAAIGLYRALPGPTTPPGMRISSQSVQIVAGQVRWVYEFEDVPDPTPSDFPLSMRQLRIGLRTSGFPLDFITTAITAIPDDLQRDLATIWYEESTQVEWDHPMTRSLISAAGITDEQATAMWMAAKDLPA